MSTLLHVSASPRGAASESLALADQFTGADAYLFSVPMWNAGVLYVLKQWIINGHITQFRQYIDTTTYRATLS